MIFKSVPHPSPTPPARVKALVAAPKFGSVFTDHMVVIRWNEEQGWHDAQVCARGPFSLDPACAVFHYAQEVFEGMKAYRCDDGRIALFRPFENARRFALSAQRLAMPQLDPAMFVAAVEMLVRADVAWVPDGKGSLYLRPFMFASEAFLGMRAAREYIFCVIASPAGAYFGSERDTISLWVSKEYSRAAKGGTGAAKCGGNYAGTLLALRQAAAEGCDQAIFLDAAEQKWVEELGGMNVFFVMRDGSMITPPLGAILAGVTRDAIISLARDGGMSVEERRYSFEQWCCDAEDGHLTEVFACGTAAVIAGVGKVRFCGGGFTIGSGRSGAVTAALTSRLEAIQRGREPDRLGWFHEVTSQ